jgi:hypothetical protein
LRTGSEITAYIRKNGQKILDARNAAFGPVVAKTPTLPDRDLAVGAATIGGVRFEFERQPDGESDWQSIVRLPDAGVVMAFDLVFPAKTHMFTVANYYDHWIAILQVLKGDAAKGFDTVMIDHGKPVGFDVIDGNIAYLRKAKEIHAAKSTAESYAEALKGTYPGYLRRRLGGFLQPAALWRHQPIVRRTACVITNPAPTRMTA